MAGPVVPGMERHETRRDRDTQAAVRELLDAVARELAEAPRPSEPQRPPAVEAPEASAA
jgi:hypothetical protein